MAHRPRKRFGQNFLTDRSVIRGIVAAIAPKTGQRLVEIGPGRGALTLPLLEVLGSMDVVELDRDLIPVLRTVSATVGELHIHEADALKFDFRELASYLGDDEEEDQRLRVVGNLPYNISTPLLFHLIDQLEAIRDMHFMLQKEVVERMVAAPGGGDYGRLSVMIQYRCRAEKLFKVAPGAFFPPPKVESAIVRLVPHAVPPVEVGSEATFANLVRQAFSQRRKTLRNNLKGLLDAAAIEAAGVDPSIRPEQLTLAQFAALSRAVGA
ncbi:16S rRNA (adenine(1518)-N(6)/adenine(1519)-N(6))-dimethyltransferase RsmA [Endothiovibrio diazotrophicus]